jgi:multidrug resistance efflux pump
VTAPPQINGYAGESSNRKAALDAQARVQRAELNAEKIGLEEAMDDLKRAEPAYEQKVISAEELSHKQYAVKKAQARLEKMEAELAATEAEARDVERSIG